MATTQARTLSITIERKPEDVYAYVRNGEHFADWLGFITSARREGDGWKLEPKEGPGMTLHFAPDNKLGVLDQVAKLPDGTEVLNAMRVSANGTGSEVTFVVLRQASMDDAAWTKDVGMVEGDLATLKRVLER